jgi:predicted ATPase
VQPIPPLAGHLTTKEKEMTWLEDHAENFAQWYQHTSLEHSKIGLETWQALKKVLPGFDSLNLREAGDSRKLTAAFHQDSKEYDISFRDLSDGQRQLVILYVVLYSLKHSHDVLFVDEPDNFVSLREIQP